MRERTSSLSLRKGFELPTISTPDFRRALATVLRRREPALQWLADFDAGRVTRQNLVSQIELFDERSERGPDLLRAVSITRGKI
jgi:hypothetical protein